MLTEEQIAALSAIFEKHGVVLAYLFGSYARGRTTPRSDVDIAVLFPEPYDKKAGWDARLNLIGEVESICRREVDVVVLNEAPPLLKHQVLKHGAPIFVPDGRLRVAFTVEALHEYWDYLPAQDRQHAALRKRIREGRFLERPRSIRRLGQD